MKTGWKRMMLSLPSTEIISTHRKIGRPTIIHLPKKAPYLNSHERRVHQEQKSDGCASRFYAQHRKTKST